MFYQDGNQAHETSQVKDNIILHISIILFSKNVWEEPLNVLSSHIIKSVVMRKVLSEDEEYWKRNYKMKQNFM